MENSSSSQIDRKQLVKEDVHSTAININSLTWEICRKVINIVDINPYLNLSKEELILASEDLHFSYYSKLTPYIVYECLIAHHEKAGKILMEAAYKKALT
jgi:hypothetical protein